MRSLARRFGGFALLAASFALAALVIRYQPFIENHVLRPIGPKVAIPLATVIFALVASAPFSVTDALAVMNGVVFGRFWGSIIDAVGIVFAALIGGLAYMLGGSIAGFASPGHDGKLFVSTLCPSAMALPLSTLWLKWRRMPRSC